VGRGWYQWVWTEYKERVRKAECSENGKMRHVESVPGMGEGREKENDGGVEFNYDIF
jgi:hypothetical protein